MLGQNVAPDSLLRVKRGKQVSEGVFREQTARAPPRRSVFCCWLSTL
jgi:hypothetical protein